MTLPARNALMALPYWPEPPGPALMSSMRLSSTNVPSSPIAVRRISMPLSLVPRMVLRDTIKPCASNEVMPVTAILVKMLPLTSPETFSNQMPLPPLLAISQSVMRMSRPAEAMHEAAPRRQLDAAAVQRDVGQPDAACAFARKHRRAAGEDKFGRAAHADQLAAAGEPQQTGAVDTGRQCERHLRAGGLVDRALQRAGLVVRAAGPHAILRGVAPERRGRRRRARGIGRHRQRAGNAGRGGPDQMPAIDVHGLRCPRE